MPYILGGRGHVHTYPTSEVVTVGEADKKDSFGFVKVGGGFCVPGQGEDCNESDVVLSGHKRPGHASCVKAALRFP